MAQHDPVKAGDKGEVRYVTLYGLANLDDVASGEAIVSSPDGSTTATLPMSVTDSANLIMKIDFGTEDTDWLPAGPVHGVWEIEYSITLDNPARVLTWPNEGYDTIRVYKELG